jgi:hypothetical protein
VTNGILVSRLYVRRSLGVDGLQKSLRSEASWFPVSVPQGAPQAFGGPEFGWALFQLIVQKIDSRAAAKTGDVVAALAFLTGRIVQRAAFRDAPDQFRIDVSGNGTSFLRNDEVNAKIGSLTAGSLASTLIDSALLAGARRMPAFAQVISNAQETMRRRGAADLRDIELSASTAMLAAEVQSDVDGLLWDASDRPALVRSFIQACGHAIGYQRTRLCPAEAAELCLSVALYAGWLDQRENLRS